MDTLSENQFRLLVLAAIRDDEASIDWHVLARAAQLRGGLDMLLNGSIAEDSREATRSRRVLQAGLIDLTAAQERVERELDVAQRHGARLTTVLDEDYPANLRLVPNLPPFLFYRGTLESADAYSIAVVGTRQASSIGLQRAARMARELSERNVRIISGLARGIDAAAHTETLRVGGRTLAVIGTGIAHCYPAEHRSLADRITEAGALLSQFWPSASAAKWTFPRRNITMSGISQATCVIEAGTTSGAKLQARFAYEHGKRVFLLRSLTESQPWAAKMLEEGRAIQVESSEQITGKMADPQRIEAATAGRQQLAFDLFSEAV